MKLQSAYLFCGRDNDPAIHYTVLDTPTIICHIIGVSSPEEGCRVAAQLVAGGCKLIELCAAFTREDVTMIEQVTDHQVAVGAVWMNSKSLDRAKEAYWTAMLSNDEERHS